MIANKLHVRNFTRKVGSIRQLCTENVRTQTETVDQQELVNFKNMKEDWWNEYGCVKPLHSMNMLRVPFVRDGLYSTGVIKKDQYNSPHPLKNVNILDVGCGGGIASEPLARLGAKVTGIDATSDLIEIAKEHSKNDINIKMLDYIYTTIEEHAKNNVEKYDAVLASEIIEHVTEKDVFLENCVKVLKPGGSIFLTTISKTLLSNFLAIFMAENVLNAIPKGTHEWDKFLEPHRLQRHLELYNCRTRLIHGMVYNYMKNTWKWSSITSVNYALHAIKKCE